ncbi:hypothetical protein [Ktedonospora formicarum]|uniref:hypothetical protein n=1 Tax=Ktedonospora formicarum TaxID=2778364 RepID=UPI001C692A52|nr:hypothetical protein [Ktedonospora formicarum]
MANILNIPYETVTQVALIPTAYTLGDEFKPATRKPVEQILHVDSWQERENTNRKNRDKR